MSQFISFCSDVNDISWQAVNLEPSQPTSLSSLYVADKGNAGTQSGPYLSFGWQSFNLLDEEGVWLDHDDQRYASCLLHAAHQAWVVHDLRPLAQGGRYLAAAAVRPTKEREIVCMVDLSSYLLHLQDTVLWEVKKLYISRKKY